MRFERAEPRLIFPAPPDSAAGLPHAIHSYVFANGEQHWANATDPQIPAALTPVVAGVNSLNNFARKPDEPCSGHVPEITGRREKSRV